LTRDPLRVVVTRPRSQAGPLVERLEAIGCEVVECPLIEIERTSDESIDASGYDWLVVTSPNGADEIARRLVGARPRVAAVGPGTAERLREHGIEPAFVPRVSSQEGLIDEFPQPYGRVLFAAAENARRRPITALGADYVPLYATRLVRPDTPPEGDVVVLASGSAARAFAWLEVDIAAVSIGPQTTAVAHEVGLRVVEEAETHDLDGLVAAVERVASRTA
jgi:uroporphyrinogen-III synthase